MLTTLIENYSDPNNVIFDPFMGSGSTGVSCIKTNRKFIGIEKDLGYFNIAENRIKEVLKEVEE